MSSPRSRFLPSLLLLALVSACSNDGGTKPAADAGVDTVDGSMALDDAGSEPAPDASTDAGPVPEPCTPGDHVDGTFGPDGGKVELCGAKVQLVPGVLDAERKVRVSVVELTKPVPFPLEQAGLAFEVDVEGDLPTAATPPLSVLVPHAKTERYVYFFWVADDFQAIEACTVTDDAIGQNVGVEGTFVALVDTEDFPETRQGLGSGTVDVSFDGTDASYDLDGTGIDTYAIYDADASGGRTYTLAATTSAGEGDLQVLRITFARTADGDASIIEITYGDLNGLYSYLILEGTPASITISDAAGNHVEGTFEAELRLGDVKKTLSGSFDATVEKFRYPPELACNFPEG